MILDRPMPYEEPPQYTEYPQGAEQPVLYTEDYYNDGKEKTTAQLLFIIGFCTFIPWVANYCMFRRSSNDSARKYAFASGVLFLIAMITMVVLIILVIVGIIVGVSVGGDGSDDSVDYGDDD